MRVVSVLAWLMVIGGIICGFSFWLLIVGRSPAGTKHALAALAYLATLLCILGAGLRTRLSWAWSATVFNTLFVASLGVMLPAIITGVKTTKQSGVAGAVVLGGIIAVPAILVVRVLFKRDVKAAFQIGDLPPLWIRVIATGYLLTSGVAMLTAFSSTVRSPFGLVHNHLAASAYEIASAIAWIVIGRGLYLLSESARRWAIYSSILSGLDYLCFVAFDANTSAKLIARSVTLFLTILIAALTVWYLHTRRGAFKKI